MNRAEAKSLLASRLDRLKGVEYSELREWVLEKRVLREEAPGESGVVYQLDSKAFWERKAEGDIRVAVLIDDGGWRAFFPLSDSFIIRSDGSFVE